MEACHFRVSLGDALLLTTCVLTALQSWQYFCRHHGCHLQSYQYFRARAVPFYSCE